MLENTIAVGGIAAQMGNSPLQAAVTRLVPITLLLPQVALRT
jgi:hypothetical protein